MISMPPRTSRVARLKPAGETVEAVVAPVSQKSLWPVVLILGMLLCIALTVAGYFYYQFRHSKEVADAKEIADLSQEIGQFMILPEGETPTLATVTDREKLAEQPFFQKAENGDKVLIYSQTGRAILYRPSQKKIVDVTTVNINTPGVTQPTEPAPAPTPAPTPEAAVEAPLIARVALYNGSKTVGITNTLEKQLTSAFPNIAVVTKDTAQKSDYTQTIVVDVTGKSVELAAKMAENLGGIVAGLPNGETAPSDADLLVIVGQN
jgi:hypothetical protein